MYSFKDKFDNFDFSRYLYNIEVGNSFIKTTKQELLSFFNNCLWSYECTKYSRHLTNTIGVYEELKWDVFQTTGIKGYRFSFAIKELSNVPQLLDRKIFNLTYKHGNLQAYVDDYLLPEDLYISDKINIWCIDNVPIFLTIGDIVEPSKLYYRKEYHGIVCDGKTLFKAKELHSVCVKYSNRDYEGFL